MTGLKKLYEKMRTRIITSDIMSMKSMIFILCVVCLYAMTMIRCFFYFLIIINRARATPWHKGPAQVVSNNACVVFHRVSKGPEGP